MPPGKLLPETPSSRVDGAQADTFRMGANYQNWRSQGTDSWLLMLTLAGAGRVATGDQCVPSHPGTVTLYAPSTPQDYGTDSEVGHWHLLWSHFHARPDWPAWLNWPEVGRGLRVRQLTDPTIFRQVRLALQEAARHSHQNLPTSKNLTINALERALLWIHTLSGGHPLDERIRHAIDHLAENLREPFSLPALAQTVGLSVSRLAHLFREQVGRPPQQYLEDLRLDRAAHLLRSSGLLIGEIADQAGYSGAFYFSHRFRRRFGCSPSAYRKPAKN